MGLLRTIIRGSQVVYQYGPRRCCHLASSSVNVLSGETDKYNGITVKLAETPDISPHQFHSLLKDSLRMWRGEGRAAVWLHVPIEQSALIEPAAREGFQFHHAENDLSVLTTWLKTDQPSALPRFATHQVGVAGIVVKEDTKEVLVIQDKMRKFTLWKFPGGLSDLGEDLCDTAVREVYEETGVKTEFQSVLTFRQQHTQPGAFGRSDLYFLCRLKPLTFDLTPCSHEVSQCRWMLIEELKQNAQTSVFTQTILKLLSYGLEEGFDQVDLIQQQFESIHKGLLFHMYHVNVPK